MQLRTRIERLEQQGESETAVLIVIGETTPAQQSLIDQRKVRLVITMPDNRRGDDGHDHSKN